VLAEQGVAALDSLDMSSLTDRAKALDSPSRMVAVNLANGNPLFRSDTLPLPLHAVLSHSATREKLKKKLELSGNDCSMEDLQHHANYVYESNHMDSGIPEEAYTSDVHYNTAVKSSSTKVKKERNSSGSKSRHPKMRQKKFRGDDDDEEGSGQDSDGGGDGNGSLMKRRRKTELQISVLFLSCLMSLCALLSPLG
jgi:hypothetical protein